MSPFSLRVTLRKEPTGSKFLPLWVPPYDKGFKYTAKEKQVLHSAIHTGKNLLPRGSKFFPVGVAFYEKWFKQLENSASLLVIPL